jgi:hypothetical protein
MLAEPASAGSMDTCRFWTARRGQFGKRIVSEPTGAGAVGKECSEAHGTGTLEHEFCLSRQALGIWKT